MEDLLICKDLYDPIKGDKGKSSDTLDADWKKLKKKTLGAIANGWTLVFTIMLPKRYIHTLFGRT